MVVIGNFTHNLLTELRDPSIKFEVIEKNEIRIEKRKKGTEKTSKANKNKNKVN